MGYKPSPKVTDQNFSIRVPSFLVANGWVMYIIHSDTKKTQRFLKPGETVLTRRHGSFEVMYAGCDHAVLHHKSLTGKVMPLFVPPQKWLCASNGAFQVHNLDYASWAKEFPPAAKEDSFDRITRINHPRGLLEKYSDLLKIFKIYWAEKFAESMQEDEDSRTFMLGARIRYGMACVMEGSLLPHDCEYQKLAEEVGSWISYREGDQPDHWE